MAQVLHRSLPRADRAEGRMSTPLSSSREDSLTGKVVKRSMRLLLQSKGFRREQVLTLIDPQQQQQACQLVDNAADRVKLLTESSSSTQSRSGGNKMITLDDLEEQNWSIHAGNIHSEYMIVAEQVFSDDINWGRIVALLEFSCTYCLYAMRQGLPESIVESVAGWTVLFMERELGGWFQQNSWEQFVTYADRILLSRQRRNELEAPKTWQTIATIGAIGIGAVLAFSLRNAFS